MTPPRRIEYAGPEDWTVWADEDGVHLRAPKGDCLEAPDVTRLMDLVQEVREQVATIIEAPRPPTPEELRAAGRYGRDAYYSKLAQRAVADALDPQQIAPF